MWQRRNVSEEWVAAKEERRRARMGEKSAGGWGMVLWWVCGVWDRVLA